MTFPKLFETTKRVSNKFDPFETRRYSVSHLNPKCLQRVSIECRQGDFWLGSALFVSAICFQAANTINELKTDSLYVCFFKMVSKRDPSNTNLTVCSRYYYGICVSPLFSLILHFHSNEWLQDLSLKNSFANLMIQPFCHEIYSMSYWMIPSILNTYRVCSFLNELWTVVKRRVFLQKGLSIFVC